MYYITGENVKTSNMATGAARVSRTGQVWCEKLSNAQGTIQLLRQHTFRVRAVAPLTVTIDGVLMMTMAAGEVEYFNTGNGKDKKRDACTEIVIAGGDAFVQVALDNTTTNPLG